MIKFNQIRLLLLLLFTPPFLSAQVEEANFFNRHYLFQERLAKGLVFDILQDEQGFMWFGTEYGLIRYDGHSQKIFQHEPENPHSLAGNVITCLAKDAADNLWVGTMYSGLHYFDRRAGRFIRYQYDAKNIYTIANNKVNEILVSENGTVWVTTEGGGIQLFEEKTGRFRRFTRPDLSHWHTDALLEDQNGTMWVGGYFGLNKWMPSDSSFVLQFPIQSIAPNGENLKALAQEANGRIWAGFQNGGLTYIDPGENDLKKVQSLPQWPDALRKEHIWDIYVDQGHHVWVATDDGLFHLRQKDSTDVYTLQPYSLTQNWRYLSLYKSEDGAMWIGTNSGVVVLAPRHKQFQHIIALRPGVTADIKRGITSIGGARNDQIWMGTVRGLYQFDMVEQHFHQSFLSEHPQLEPFADNKHNFSALYLDGKDRLWMATIEEFNQGFNLFCYHIPQKKLIDFSVQNKLFSSFATFSITEDHFGDLWFANQNGLVRYFTNLDSVQLFQHNSQQEGSLSSNRINKVWLSNQGNLWIGTNDAGLQQFDFTQQHFQRYAPLTGDASSFENMRITTIYEEAPNSLWLGTDGGLVLFDQTKGAYQRYGNRNGLLNYVIKGINQDEQGLLWVASQNDLSRFDPEKEFFVNYTAVDGVPIKEFWDRVSYRDRNGYLYFGGDQGLLTFHPDSIRDNEYSPPIVFTNFLLFNKDVIADPGNKLLPAPIHLSPKITLRHDQNVFTIGFAALSYINPGSTRFEVKMEGFEQNWQVLGSKTEATYTNLDPGTYLFKVKAANGDGLWNEEGAALQIVVLPPWYRTLWSYFLYVIVLISGTYIFYHFQLNRRLAEAEAVRLRELDAIKTRLYTNITHEFRTPLTLIQGPVERALLEPAYTMGKRELEVIRQNCRRLLNLIRQMLDLNKLEVGTLQVDYLNGDVIPALRYIVDAFGSFAESQDVQLNLDTPDLEIRMDYDQEKLFDIISNLVSNAIKFTQAGGEVNVKVKKITQDEKEWLEVAVRDNGIGIAFVELNKVFDRFYQTNRKHLETREESAASGYGIGLALSKKLAELMGGRITVSSEEGRGSTFSLHLPIRQAKEVRTNVNAFPDVYVPRSIQREDVLPVEEVFENMEGASILIVEDNADVARFIAESLPGYYQTRFARDGQEGIDLATEHIPDLIISDVLMPRADGFSLTNSLKNDYRTSHIPIILLTAKADVNSRIEGLTKGADAYLAKPFHSQELQIRVENLIESRRRLQVYYLQQSGLEEFGREEQQSSPQEHTFLKKARQLIENHLDQSSYSIEDLATDLHMSPSQLYRKMIALTGQSSSKFFRNIQISRAKKMLSDTDLSISEIAYQNGFNDPAYFTRVFTAETGESPTVFRSRK